jgi:hypothetical protein
MNSQRPPLDQVFILRFWRETTDVDGDVRWRVLIRNINTRRRDLVDDVQRAFTIVASNLKAAVDTHEEPEGLDVEASAPEQ